MLLLGVIDVPNNPQYFTLLTVNGTQRVRTCGTSQTVGRDRQFDYMFPKVGVAVASPESDTLARERKDLPRGAQNFMLTGEQVEQGER